MTTRIKTTGLLCSSLALGLMLSSCNLIRHDSIQYSDESCLESISLVADNDGDLPLGVGEERTYRIIPYPQTAEVYGVNISLSVPDVVSATVGEDNSITVVGTGEGEVEIEVTAKGLFASLYPVSSTLSFRVRVEDRREQGRPSLTLCLYDPSTLELRRRLGPGEGIIANVGEKLILGAEVSEGREKLSGGCVLLPGEYFDSAVFGEGFWVVDPLSRGETSLDFVAENSEGEEYEYTFPLYSYSHIEIGALYDLVEGKAGLVVGQHSQGELSSTVYLGAEVFGWPGDNLSSRVGLDSTPWQGEVALSSGRVYSSLLDTSSLQDEIYSRKTGGQDPLYYNVRGADLTYLIRVDDPYVVVDHSSSLDRFTSLSTFSLGVTFLQEGIAPPYER